MARLPYGYGFCATTGRGAGPITPPITAAVTCQAARRSPFGIGIAVLAAALLLVAGLIGG